MKKCLVLFTAFSLHAQITSIPTQGGGGGTPGGSNTQFQYNNSGVFGGTPTLVLNADGTINVVNKAFTFASPSTPTWNNAGTTTCDFTAANTCKVSMVGNQSTTMAFSGMHGASLYTIKFLQDATGGATITYPASVLSAPQPTTAANDETDVSCMYDGAANFLCFQSGSTAAWRGLLTPEASTACPSTTGKDCFYADSTAHRWKMNNNNGTAVDVLGRQAHDIATALTCSAGSASGTAYTCTTSPSFTPATGDHILFKADVANTGAATLAVNGQAGPPALRKQGGGTALVANDLLASQWTELVFDGTNWQMQGQTGNTVSGTTCDWFVLTNQCFMGDFSDFSSGTPANNTGFSAGTTPLYYVLSGGTVANLANALGSGTSPTGIQVTSNGGANNYIGAMIGLQQGGSVQKFLPTNFLTTAATFDFKFVTSLNTFAGVAGDNEKFFIGCTDGFPTNTNAFGVEYISGTDTQWTAVSINGGTATRGNIAAGDTNRHNLEVKKTTTANSVQMCVDATCATAITTNIPTTALNCGIALQGTTTTSVTANLYKFFLMLTGMTNP